MALVQLLLSPLEVRDESISAFHSMRVLGFCGATRGTLLPVSAAYASTAEATVPAPSPRGQPPTRHRIRGQARRIRRKPAAHSRCLGAWQP